MDSESEKLWRAVAPWTQSLPKESESESENYLVGMELDHASDQILGMPAIIGHRGVKSVAPENTLASVRAAKELGCSWVELDVMLTKDKVPVIHHDNTLDRCTNGSGNVWDHTIEEIEKLDAGFRFCAHTTERIPRLTAVLACCRELSLGLNLEVKHVTENSSDTPSPLEQEMEEEIAHVVCDTIEKCNVQPSELIFSSFSRPAIAVLRRRLPHFATSFLVEEIPSDWFDFVSRNGCASLNFQWNAPANFLDRIVECAQQFACYAYTVNDGAVARVLLSLGVRGVFSDCPHLVSADLRLNADDSSAWNDWDMLDGDVEMHDITSGVGFLAFTQTKRDEATAAVVLTPFESLALGELPQSAGPTLAAYQTMELADFRPAQAA